MRSSRVDTFTLVTLGRLTLLSASGHESESLAKRRLKLALLVVLAMAKRPVSRATLAEMFWGDQDESRARHSLSDALSHLRRELGRGAIATHEAEVSLAPDAPVVIDAAMFADAADAKNFARAAELYSGPFLDGVEIEACPSFEQWVMRERRRLETVFLQVCAQQCMAFARAREWEQCGALASRWLDAAPLSVDAALFRLNAVKAPGTREAAQRAIDEFEQLTARLARDFELTPEKPVRQLVESLRDNMKSLPVEPVVVAPLPVAVVADVTPNEVAATPIAIDQRPVASRPSTPSRRRLGQLASGSIAALALLTAMAAQTRPPAGDPGSRPRVAIAIDVPVPDTSIAWLVDGLPQMIVSELERSPDVEVISPAQVRALLQRRGTLRQAADGREDLRDLARRLGATVVVSGSIGHDDRALVLDLTVRDAATGRLLRNDALARPNAVALADEAAARVLAAVNAERPGLHIADLETSSVEAYQHFVRAMKTEGEGRIQESQRDLDAAIALDSGFVSAVHLRLDRAIAWQQSDVADRLREVLRRNGALGTEFDRLRTEAYDAVSNAEVERSVAIARQLVRRYPRDPRAYSVLTSVLGLHGRFAEAEEIWQRALALDSLTMEAGPGPCSPCAGYGALARAQMLQGKWADAERSTRRWVALQPDAPASWETLAMLMAYTQRDREAIEAAKRAMSLTGQDAGSDYMARILLMVRRYDAVDSLIASWMASPSADLKASAYDLRILLLREHGQFRATGVAIDQMRANVPNPGAFPVLIEGNNLARLGDYAGAIRVYERSSHGHRPGPVPFPPRGSNTRGFCWHHALLADAIAPSGDLVRLRALADTLEYGCAKSFFGRDRVLYHHARGLVALAEGRLLDAESELRQAHWSVAEGWTRTNVALAKTELMLGKPRAAVSALRDAYAGQVDGMGRYQPRSEIDFLMSQAYKAAGEPDSAAVYYAFARRAWKDADPEVKRLLDHTPEPVVAIR